MTSAGRLNAMGCPAMTGNVVEEKLARAGLLSLMSWAAVA